MTVTKDINFSQLLPCINSCAVNINKIQAYQITP